MHGNAGHTEERKEEASQGEASAPTCVPSWRAVRCACKASVFPPHPKHHMLTSRALQLEPSQKYCGDSLDLEFSHAVVFLNCNAVCNFRFRSCCLSDGCIAVAGLHLSEESFLCCFLRCCCCLCRCR